MTVDIFIKSYKKDFNLLKYSLLSITKNVTGYNKVIILIPERDKSDFDTRELPERTEINYVEDSGNGYLKQQVYKMNAFKYCHADYILFSDSDCIFDHKINLLDFVDDGKPEILYTHYDKVGDGIIWKAPTEILMHDTVEYEFMRRNCLIYHRDTLVKISMEHQNLEFIVMQSQRFSEFNFMGAWAFKHEREKYNFINTDDWSYVPPKAIQLWSHHDKTGSEVHQKEYQRALDAINKVFELNISDI